MNENNPAVALIATTVALLALIPLAVFLPWLLVGGALVVWALTPLRNRHRARGARTTFHV